MMSAIRKPSNKPATERAVLGPYRGSPPPISDPTPRWPVCRTYITGFSPATNPTDIVALQMTAYGKTVALSKVTIDGTCTNGGAIAVQIQRSANGGGGTSAAQTVHKDDARQGANYGAVYAYSANRATGGNGIDVNRTPIANGTLYLGKTDATIIGTELVFAFDGANRPTCRDLIEWLVINLNGAAMPAGTALNISLEWVEEPRISVQFAGDSTTSNAFTMFSALGFSGAVPAICNFNNSGSNGAMLEDMLDGTGGHPYPFVSTSGILARLGHLPSVLVLCYGINDLREGAGTRAYMVSMIDAALHATKYGTTSAGTYTSTHPDGDGATFTWPATVAANPDCRIILWSPNTLTTDGNGSSFVTLTGRFASGYTVPQAAQVISDDLYEAYESFRDDPRVFRLVHKRDIFGPTSTTVANSGVYAYDGGAANRTAPTNESLMTDILHPNARGQVLCARQIAPHLRDAIADIYATDLI